VTREPQKNVSFAALLRTSLLVCAAGALFVFLVWILFRRLRL
jgi:hypothetical protein